MKTALHPLFVPNPFRAEGMNFIMKNNLTARHITRGGVIAAAYAVLTLILYPIAFGPVQCRLSEALTVLPVFTPSAIWGLTLGCAISNGVAILTGNTIAGVWDVLFGSLATGIAAVCTYFTRKIQFKGLPLLSMVFPVVLNALVVGAELTIVEKGFLDWPLFGFNALSVGAGQAIACFGGGLLLFKAVDKTKLGSLL